MKMTYKFSIILFLHFFFFVCGNAQTKKQIVITGKIKFLNPEAFSKYNMVWLKKWAGNNPKSIDSIAVSNDGIFRFNLVVSKPGLYQLDILKWQTVAFWADHDVTISCRGYDTARYKTKNSGLIEMESNSSGTQLISLAMHSLYLDAQNKADILSEGFAAQKYRNKDSTWYSYFRKENLYRKIEDQGQERLKMMINSSLKNPASVYLLTLINWKKDSEFVVNELNKLLAVNPNFEEATTLKKEVVAYVAQKNRLQKGVAAPEIAYLNPDGNITALTSFKGKYVIVDFWASWCGPCRKAIPKLKDLYTQYKDKGFEILSISVDSDDAAWRRAMSEENMPWSQVVSPNKDKTLKDFMIQGIPTLFLLDREGKIIEIFTGYSPRLEELLKERMAI